MCRFRDIAALILGILLLLLVGTAHGQTISNTASAQWASGGNLLSAASNTVSFPVTPAATLQVLTPSVSSPLSVIVNAPMCNGSLLLPDGIGSDLQPASVRNTSTIRPGEVLLFKVVAASQNRDPAAIDKVTAVLTTSDGDREEITVNETGVNTGEFVGAIPTAAIPPTPVQGDCRLSLAAQGTIAIECMATGTLKPIAVGRLDVLADPYGVVFDSEDGRLVNGAQVTLVDARTGAPARVFAPDGKTLWPSTVTTGSQVTDAAGNIYPLGSGEYWFPLAPIGTYRVVVVPPGPYTAPSRASPASLAGLLRPDGKPVTVVAGSFGDTFALATPEAVNIDVPVDRPPIAVALSKTASRASAAPGDVVFYTIRASNPDTIGAKRQVVLTDTPSPWLRLRKDSIRLDGASAPAAVSVGADGKTLVVALGTMAPGATHVLTYAMTVRADAPAGQAVNRVDVVDARGNHATTQASIKLERETIASRMTIIGRVTDHGCDPVAPRRGIPGVRVMLEDGSFALTDRDGRYHFEGVVPGTHVVAAARDSLPVGGHFADCVRSTRSAGNPASRFVVGQGGSLAVADFAAILPDAPADTAPAASTDAAPAPTDEASDRGAAGAETDWLGLGDGPTGFLFPALDHNPRAPAIRVVIRHRRGQSVDLAIDGAPVDKVAFDGAKAAPAGYAVSVWRGIPLANERTVLSATVRNADGSTDQVLRREVFFTATPARAEIVAQRSRLVADGRSRPVLAVRVLDRDGHPVHAGLTGQFSLNAPYESAAANDALQARALTGLGRNTPTWTVKGDDGVALVELAPTMVSGPLRLTFAFTDGEMHRQQVIESWVIPGDQPWTLVGLAEGSVGARSVADAMERTGSFDSDLGDHARTAFYAKGRVLGRFLLTLAYDSAKQKADQRALGAIDPSAYYTVFADGSERRFDAPSREKLYVRIETRAFFALFGDFVTGFDEAELARYQRTLTGVNGEGRFGVVKVRGFAARSANATRHDEFQGAGISGPYRLSARGMVANTETVAIEVRDRFRSEIVVSRQVLTRFVDYDIDTLAGTISFRQPLLSRDPALNPQFAIVDYDVLDARGGAVNAGLRTSVTTRGGHLRLGASAVTDTAASTSGARTSLAAADARLLLGANSELRAEVAASRRNNANAVAWLVEYERHSGRLDLLAYARSAAPEFGLGQQTRAELGRRKLGVDARYRVSQALSFTASSWHDTSLTDAATRNALELSGTWHSAATDVRLGASAFRDRLADGTSASSTLLEGGVTHRYLGNRLELSADGSLALGGADSVDLPRRYRLGARYALTRTVKLTGMYELAQGSAAKARTAQVGFELAPWTGARVLAGLGQQDVVELGKRSFANFGLNQSLQVTSHLAVDATLESSKTIGGINAATLVNRAHPAASGGLVAASGTIAEDFTAVTLGGAWRNGPWALNMRGELRNGSLADRKGVTFGAIRQLGDGQMVGAGVTWTRAVADTGARTAVFEGTLSGAFRPGWSAVAMLAKLQFRSDAIVGATAGDAGAAGTTALTIGSTGDGNGKTQRLIGSLSANWSPQGRDRDGRTQRSEVGVFAAVRYNLDQVAGTGFASTDLASTSLLGGLDLRIGLGAHFDLGLVATVRHSPGDGTTSFALGPQLGISPVRDVLLTIGYNIKGFRDRDFAAMRSTQRGVFASVRMKFDNDSFRFLGLGK